MPEEQNLQGDAQQQVMRDMEERSVENEAKRIKMDYYNLEHAAINPDVIYSTGLNRKEMESALVLPFFKMAEKVRVAVAKPEDPATEAALAKMRDQGLKLHKYLVSDSGLRDRIAALYDSGLVQDEEEEVTDFAVTFENFQEVLEELQKVSENFENEKPEKALQIVMVGSVKAKASDVHIEQFEKEGRVRFRIDGILHDVASLSKKAYHNFIQIIKLKSAMKMNVDTIPQDGRFGFLVEDRKVDVRVSTLPTSTGESVVMRLLDSGKALLGLDVLGFEGKQREWVEESLKEPVGMMLTTGPTGSGKTSTLYAVLNELHSEDVKIITLEDPVEYYLSGVVQSQLDHERGYDFAKGLRAILRQDPDIVMVGEIRDLETAEIASQAALTGHKVLSTLHTNDAVGVIARFVNMGLERYMVGPALKLVIAQRLLRKVCDECKEECQINDELHKVVDGLTKSVQEVDPAFQKPETFHKGKGCPACSNTGYKGRVGIYEVFKVDDKLQAMIVAGASEEDIRAYLRSQGMMGLKEDGLRKVAKGLSTMEELERVTGDVSEEVEFEIDEAAEASSELSSQPEVTKEDSSSI